MSVEFEVVEIIGDDTDEVIGSEAPSYTVTEIDDEFNGSGPDGICIEEMSPSDYIEEDGAQGTEATLVLLDPEIEEPDETAQPRINANVELVYGGRPIEFGSTLHADTTIKDLFSLSRFEIDGVDDNSELWFHFEPLGLHIGEENLHAREPTLGHLLRLLDSQRRLRVEIENRESFFSRFNAMLTSLDLDGGDNPSKRMKVDEMWA